MRTFTIFTILFIIQKSFSLQLKDILLDNNETYKQIKRFSVGKKYILLWESDSISEISLINLNETNCSHTNCIIVPHSKFLNHVQAYPEANVAEVISWYDAVVLGENGLAMNNWQLPPLRSPHQKYILISMESSDNFPACGAWFDDFFNWTMTYKLNSDFPIPYFEIRDMEGTVVGPSRNITWANFSNSTSFVDGSGNLLLDYSEEKTKAVAWFASNCAARSDRDIFVNDLQVELYAYDLFVHVYGVCGPHQCAPLEACDVMLAKEFYFYLALENSISDDYVTEKLLRALHNRVVPIVYGGANYSRFLPPGSYINARKYTVSKVAAMIAKAIKTPAVYNKYFRWREYYSYRVTERHLCPVCQALNSATVNHLTRYPSFRYWWNPDYKTRCKPRRIRFYSQYSPVFRARCSLLLICILLLVLPYMALWWDLICRF